MLEFLLAMRALLLRALSDLEENPEPLEMAAPRDLWLEKEVKSVANVARSDVRDFLALAAEIPIRPEVQEYPLESANQALRELKQRKIRGAKVLRIAGP